MDTRVRFVVVVVALLLATLCLWPQIEATLPDAPAGTSASAHEPSPSTATHEAGQPAEVAPQIAPQPRRRLVDAPPARFWIRGRLARAGVGVPGRAVICYRGWGQKQNETVTKRDGLFEFEVDPAEYELLVPHVDGATREQYSRPRFPIAGFSLLHAARAPVNVSDADRDVQIELPTQAIVVHVRNAETLALIAGATVVWRPPPPVMEELHVTTNAAGYVRIADVRAGEHQVAASARAFAAAVQSVTVDEHGPDGVVDMRLKATCAVDVVLMGEQGQAVPVSAAHKVALIHKPIGWPVYADQTHRPGVRLRAKSTPFDNLSVGRYEVMLDGDTLGENGDERTVRFAPCIQKEVRAFELSLGILRRVEVPVEQRSYARLRAVDAEGALLAGTLRVAWVDARGLPRTVMPAPWQHGAVHDGSHFDGYLRRGRYSLVFTSDDKTWHEQLVVNQRLVDRDLRPTW